MRVWLLTSELPPDVAGGIATYVDGFARLLGASGHEVTVLAATLAARDETIAPGVRVVGLARRHAGGLGVMTAPPPPPYDVLTPAAAFAHEIAEVVLARAREDGPPDVVESQEYLGLPYFLLLRKLTERSALARTPVVVHLHSPDFEIARVNREPRFRFPRYWIGEMEKFAIAAADAVLSPSHYLAERVRRSVPGAPGIACIPYPSVVTSGGEGAGGPPRAGELVYVGRLEVRKGVLELVEACSRLWADGERFRLTLVGGDDAFRPEATTVGSFIRARYARWVAAGQLELVGAVPRADAIVRMRRAWAVVVPSLWDNFPNVCMEAMGLGRVVVASSAGGQAEMLGDAGIVFDWGVPGDLERKLRQALALDEGERARLGDAAAERIRALCAPERVYEQRIGHYEDVIARQQERRTFPAGHGPATDLPEAGQRGLVSLLVSGDVPAPAGIEVETVAVDALAGYASAAGAARGEFLGAVGPDVSADGEFFTRAIAVLERYANVWFVYSWVRSGDGVVRPTWTTSLPHLLGQDGLPVAVVMRRAALLRGVAELGGRDARLDDHELWLVLARLGGVGVSLPFPLARVVSRRPEPDALLERHDGVTHRHAEAYRDHAVALANLLEANGPSHAWGDPAAAPAMRPAATLRDALDQLGELSRGIRDPSVVGRLASVRTLLGELAGQLPPWWTSPEDPVLHDAAVGARLVRRLRDSRLAGLVLRNPRLRRAFKRALGV